MGHAMREIWALPCPNAASLDRNRAHLVADPINPAL
jgi:hypothetical protein